MTILTITREIAQVQSSGRDLSHDEEWWNKAFAIEGSASGSFRTRRAGSCANLRRTILIVLDDYRWGDINASPGMDLQEFMRKGKRR